MVKSNYIHSTWHNIAERYGLHLFQSNAGHLEFIDSFLADNKYLFAVAEHAEGGVCDYNPTQWESNAANQCPVSTLLLGGTNHRVYVHKVLSLGE